LSLNALQEAFPAILPNSAKPELGPISTGLGEIYQFVLDFKEKQSGDARVKQLMELKGVARLVCKTKTCLLSRVLPRLTRPVALKNSITYNPIQIKWLLMEFILRTYVLPLRR
jgi:hypothetical protein